MELEQEVQGGRTLDWTCGENDTKEKENKRLDNITELSEIYTKDLLF